MQIFIFNQDRNNKALVKSLEDVLIKKTPLLSFGALESEVISKNNGYLINATSDKDVALIWTAVKMISRGSSASYWITDYGKDFKFISLRRSKFDEFSKSVDINATDLENSMKSNFSTDKKKSKLDVIKLEDLEKSSDLYLDAKFNPTKPMSMAFLGKKKVLIKLPKDSQVIIRGENFRTNNEDIKKLLIEKGFSEDESIPNLE